MGKTAIIDIDNTLWQFCDAFYEELIKVNANFPTTDNWTRWDIWEGYCSEDDFNRAINNIHANQDSERYKPYTEARGFLLALRQNGYHITIASHRSPDYRRPTEKWLSRHALVYDELHLSHHKTDLISTYIDIVVDDSPQVLEKAVENGAWASGLLFPWNKAYSGNGFRLCRNLSEILDGILKR